MLHAACVYRWCRQSTGRSYRVSCHTISAQQQSSSLYMCATGRHNASGSEQARGGEHSSCSHYRTRAASPYPPRKTECRDARAYASAAIPPVSPARRRPADLTSPMPQLRQIYRYAPARYAAGNQR